jgi:L-threonylcarbamoyladenylate synthase
MMVLGTGGFRQWESIVAMPRDAEDYARRFYAVLRDLDSRGLNVIYIEMPPDEPKWAAVRDRIRRATKPM